jgi:hypothetical protein
MWRPYYDINPNFIEPQAPSRPISDGSFQLVSQVVSYHDNGVPKEVLAYRNKAPFQYQTTLLGGRRSQPLISVTDARATEVALLTAENAIAVDESPNLSAYPAGEGIFPAEIDQGMDCGEASGLTNVLGFAHSGSWSFAVTGGKVKLKAVLEPGHVLRRMKVTGWIFFNLAGIAPVLRIKSTDGSVAEVVVRAPTEVLKPRKWQKWEAEIELPASGVAQGVEAWIEAGTVPAGGLIHLDDFVLAPANATYGILGYDGFGAQISEYGSGGQTVWNRYSAKGVGVGRTDERGRFRTQAASHRAVEDAQ